MSVEAMKEAVGPPYVSVVNALVKEMMKSVAEGPEKEAMKAVITASATSGWRSIQAQWKMCKVQKCFKAEQSISYMYIHVTTYRLLELA